MLHCLQLHTTPAKSREYGGFREGIFYAFEKVVKQHGAALAYPTHVSDCSMHLQLVMSFQGALQGCCHRQHICMPCHLCQSACPREDTKP